MRKTRALAQIPQLKRLERNNSAGITERRASVWARVVKSLHECAAAAAGVGVFVCVPIFFYFFKSFWHLLQRDAPETTGMRAANIKQGFFYVCVPTEQLSGVELENKSAPRSLASRFVSMRPCKQDCVRGDGSTTCLKSISVTTRGFGYGILK